MHREDTQSSSDIHPRLGNSSFVAWNRLNRSFFFSHNCSQVTVDRLKDSSLTYASDPHCLSPVIVAASAVNLHPSLASLLNYSSISSFLDLCSCPKKISHLPLCLLIFFLSLLHADPFSKVHFNSFASFSFQFCLLLLAVSTCVESPPPIYSLFTCTS